MTKRHNLRARLAREQRMRSRIGWFLAAFVVVGIAARFYGCNVGLDEDGDLFYAAEEARGEYFFDCDDFDPNVRNGEAYYLDADMDGFGTREYTGKVHEYLCYVCLDDSSSPSEVIAKGVETDCDTRLESIPEEDGVTIPSEYQWVRNDLDCDDSDPDRQLGMFLYKDSDGDGLGNPDRGLAKYVCPPDPGNADEVAAFQAYLTISEEGNYSLNGCDCDDTNNDSEDKASFYVGEIDGIGRFSTLVCGGGVPSGYTLSSVACEDQLDAVAWTPSPTPAATPE